MSVPLLHVNLRSVPAVLVFLLVCDLQAELDLKNGACVDVCGMPSTTAETALGWAVSHGVPRPQADDTAMLACLQHVPGCNSIITSNVIPWRPGGPEAQRSSPAVGIRAHLLREMATWLAAGLYLLGSRQSDTGHLTRILLGDRWPHMFCTITLGLPCKACKDTAMDTAPTPASQLT